MRWMYIVLIVLLLSYTLISPLVGGQLIGAEPAKKGPTIITSDSLIIYKKENKALFKGSVVARKDEITISADSMLVYYDETGSRIKRIEAEGNVKVVKDSKTIISERAVYLGDEDSITFTGDPIAMDGRNMVKGDKIIYYISEDRSVITQSKVFLKEESTLSGQTREDAGSKKSY